MGEKATSTAGRGAANLLKMMTGQVATLVVVTVSGFVIPRILGPESYGEYAAVLAVLAVLMMASFLGLQPVAVRFLAPIWSGGRRGEAITLGSSIWTAHLVLAAGAGAAATLWLALSPALARSLRICFLLGGLCLLQTAYRATRGLLLPVGHVGTLAAFDFLRAVLALPAVVFSYQAFGLPGVFAALTALHAILLLASGAVLSRILPLRFGLFRWSSLRPYAGYGIANFIGMLAATVQARFSIYVVAIWVAGEQAGFLAIAIQFYNLTRELVLAARRSLMPILAELEESGQRERLRYWGGLIMRYGAAGSCVMAVGWSLVGRDVIAGILTEAFAPAFPCVNAILLGVVFFCCAASCIGLLNIRGRAGVAAVNTAIYAVVTGFGLVLTVPGGSPDVALRVASVYVVAAAVYWGSSYFSLGLLGGLWLPLRRTLLLILPAALQWPASAWDGSLLGRLAALGTFLVVYGWLATRWGLLPASEIREIVRILRRPGEGSGKPVSHEGP